MAVKQKAKKAGRFAGVKAAGEKLPLLPAGSYRCTVLKIETTSDSGKDWLKVTAMVDEVRRQNAGDPVKAGDEVLAVLLCLTGRAFKPSQQRIKAMAIALMGCANEGEYDELDPDGLFCDHICGDGDGQDADGNDFPAFEGLKFDVDVSKGNPRGEDGDYFREWAFRAVG